MIRDQDIREWSALWTSAGAEETPVEARRVIVRRVKRQSLYQRLFAVVEGLVAVIMGALLIAASARASHPADLPAVIAFMIILVVIVAWGIRARRGLWRVGGESTSDFLDLSLRRCRQRLRMVAAGYLVLAAEAAVFIPWLWIRSATGEGRLQGYARLALLAGTSLAVLAVVHRRTRKDLVAVAEIRRSLEGNGED